MNRKSILKQAVRAIADNADQDIDDIPDAILSALAEYECEGEAPGVKVKLIVSFVNEPNTTDQACVAGKGT